MSRPVAIALIIVGLVILGTHWQPVIVHLSQETGTSNGASRAYDFWSGFGSDLGEVTLVVGLFTLFRHHNCHVKGCWHLGRPVDGTPYVACPTHHPAHEGAKRGVSLETIRAAHQNRRR